MGLLALHALLTSDRLLATLAGARVRTGALAVYWQAASMTIATPALDVLESLDVLRDLASQRTLNDELRIDDRSVILVEPPIFWCGCLLFSWPSCAVDKTS